MPNITPIELINEGDIIQVFTLDSQQQLKPRYIKLQDLRTSLNSVGTNVDYKVYTALLTQSGTAAPTAEVIENTLGTDPILARSETGEYSINISAVATTGIVVSFPHQDDSNNGLFLLSTDIIRKEADYNNSYADGIIYISTKVKRMNDNTVFNTDEALSNSLLEIRVYSL